MTTDLGSSSASGTRFHHVANGTHTTRLIESAGIAGTRSIWADPLYEGPVPGGLTDAELLGVRSRYLSGPEPGNLEAVNDLTQWRAAIERHESYDELILWFEHDLFDQLNLIQLLTWIHERVPATKTVSLVCVGSFPGHPRFMGLGELTPRELASLLVRRQRVVGAHYRLADRAWQAFRAPTPEALDDLRRSDTAALPYLAPAIGRFLQEYPWTIDGLSRTERQLFQVADAGPIALSAALPRMHDGEAVYYVTDRTLSSLARQLSQTSPPLLTLASHQAAGGWQGARAVAEESVALTDTGRAVLAGQLDKIAVCGIDRWLGGVQLRSHASWRWTGSSQSLVRFAAP